MDRFSATVEISVPNGHETRLKEAVARHPWHRWKGQVSDPTGGELVMYGQFEWKIRATSNDYPALFDWTRALEKHLRNAMARSLDDLTVLSGDIYDEFLRQNVYSMIEHPARAFRRATE